MRIHSPSISDKLGGREHDLEEVVNRTGESASPHNDQPTSEEGTGLVWLVRNYLPTPNVIMTFEH